MRAKKVDTFIGHGIYKHKTDTFNGYCAKVTRPTSFHQWHYAETIAEIRALLAEEMQFELDVWKHSVKFGKELDALIK